MAIPPSPVRRRRRRPSFARLSVRHSDGIIEILISHRSPATLAAAPVAHASAAAAAASKQKREEGKLDRSRKTRRESVRPSASGGLALLWPRPQFFKRLVTKAVLMRRLRVSGEGVRGRRALRSGYFESCHPFGRHARTETKLRMSGEGEGGERGPH